MIERARAAAVPVTVPVVVTSHEPGTPWWRNSGLRFEIELLRELPAICCAHGLPAIGRRSDPVYFHEGPRGREQLTTFSLLRVTASNRLRLRSNPIEITTRLRGDWPVCSRCLQNSSRQRGISRSIGVFGMVCVLGMVVSKVFGFGQAAVVAFAVAVMPVWLPVGLLLASSLRRRATTFVRCRPLDSMAAVELEVHPVFAAAMAASGDR